MVEGWLEQPNVQALGPGEQHWSLFRQLLVEGQASGDLTSGDLTSEAQLAALTM